MNDNIEIIEREKQFWTGTAEYYERWLGREVLMVFPSPVGILKRDDAIAGIRAGGRWISIDMTEVSVHRISTWAVALAYQARARKPESASDYEAFVGSVYVKDSDGWKLAFHQHTPVVKHEPGSRPSRNR